MSHKIKVIIALLWLSGCSIGPDYQRPTPYSENDLSTGLGMLSGNTALPASTWYKSWNDDTLNRLISAGLQLNSDLKTALENLQQARISLNISRSQFGPQITAKGNYLKNDSFVTADNKNLEAYFQTGFDAAWELDIWGGTRRLNESNQALLTQAYYRLQDIKNSITAEIAADYISYRETENLLHITEQNLDLQQKISALVQQKLKAGLADELAYEQAKSAVITTNMQIPQLKALLNSYQASLSLLTGILPQKLNLGTSTILARLPSDHTHNLQQIPASVILNRPDVRAVEENLHAQNALIGNKMSALLPSVSLSGFLGWQNTSLSPMFASNYQIYNLGSNVNLPLWNWNRLLNEVKLQKSQTAQAATAYEKAILNALKEIRQSAKNLAEETSRNQQALLNKETKDKILDLSLVKYQNGLIDFSDVLTAEQNKLEAQQSYIKSLSQWYLYSIAFYKSLGGGYTTLNHNNRAD